MISARAQERLPSIPVMYKPEWDPRYLILSQLEQIPYIKDLEDS
jgi:hypothetical protein